jgi:hypothetical protein
MLLHIAEDFLSHFVTAVNLVHPGFDGRVLVVHLVFQDLALGFQIGNLEVDLLKDVKFAIGLEDCVTQIFDFVGTLFLVDLCLITEVCVLEELMVHWFDQVAQQSTHLGFYVEPQ